MVKGGLIPATLVALQTALRVLLGTPMERKYKLSRGGGLRVFPMRGFLGIGVGLACAMAHLAAGDRIGVRGGQRRVLGLPVLLKLGFVAGPAAVGTRVGTVCCGPSRRHCD